MSSVSPFSGQLAAIDMGSNSFRLEIGHLPQGKYKRIDYLKETVRLGGGLDAQGLLSEEAVLRGLACLERFARRLAGFEAFQVRAVATQTLREARNRDAFLARAQTVLGFPIEVISGREEARLIYAGVARLQPSDKRRLVIDIGGRSTEMILGQERTPLRAESFQIGSVSLSMKYFADGRFTEQAFRAAQVAAGAEFEEALEPFAATHWVEALGSSGTAGAVSQVLAASGISDGRITAEGLRWCMDQCLRAGSADKLSLAGLKDDRRAVVGGGLAILYTLVMNFDIAALMPARGALRQGVLFDLFERREAAGGQPRAQDARDATVRELQQRWHVDKEQARRVRETAERLYAQVQPQASEEQRRELRWACALHEIGMMVSHHDHHRHSAYLLAHLDAPGFSQSQQRRLADLVLAQRGGLRKVDTQLASESFAWQALCLRLAVILSHPRRDLDAASLPLRRSSGGVALSLDTGWTAANPRTTHLLEQEAAAWSRTAPFGLALA